MSAWRSWLSIWVKKTSSCYKQLQDLCIVLSRLSAVEDDQHSARKIVRDYLLKT